MNTRIEPHSPGYAPLDFDFNFDIELDPAFDQQPPVCNPHWSSQELADAMPLPASPLHHFDFTPSANDAAAHRPRRGGSFLAAPQLPSRFRIGG